MERLEQAADFASEADSSSSVVACPGCKARQEHLVPSEGIQSCLVVPLVHRSSPSVANHSWEAFVEVHSLGVVEAFEAFEALRALQKLKRNR